jgi:transposase-like protein
VTLEDIVYDRRVRLMEYAAKIGNVAEACRVFGVSRKTYYEWVKKAERYGLSALLPKEAAGHISRTRCRVRRSR